MCVWRLRTPATGAALRRRRMSLRRPEDLLRWAEKARNGCRSGWSRRGKRFAHLRRSRRRVRDAIGVRETIHRCFAATAAGREPDAADLAALNAALGEGAAAAGCVRADGRLRHRSRRSALLLAPVLWSAADLLVGPAATACAAMLQSGVRLAVPGRQQERQSAMVLDERVRESRQGASALPAAEGRLT